MMSNEERLYFDWLCRLIYKTRKDRVVSYSRLLERLYFQEFAWILPLDRDRAQDGLNMRSEYGIVIHKPCSILEMMIALAVRCENDTMANNEKGNRTGYWFWSMIASLGLAQMSDQNYDEAYVEHCLFIFLNRRYEPNGKGGLFTVLHAEEDMRQIPIWRQLNLYLIEILIDEGALERRA